MDSPIWAQAVLVIHFLFILGTLAPIPLIFLGKFLDWSWVRNPWFRWSHLAMIVLVVVQDLMGWTCPLTDLEEHLRYLSGQDAYGQSFVAYWVERLLYYEWPPFAFTLLYLGLGAAILFLFLWVPPRWPKFTPSKR